MMSGVDVMYPPSFNVSSKQMPEIKDWKVGKNYKLVIEVKQKSVNENEDGEVSSNLELVAYAVKHDNFDKMDDKEFEEYQSEAMSNKK